jgi:hypothetical protein
MKWTVVLTALALALLPDQARAEDAPFAQYQYSRDTGQIRITTGFMDRASDLDARKTAMEKTGIVILESDKARAFVRPEKVGKHTVVTTLSIAPPVGHGEGGASSSVDVTVVLDGVTIVSCPLSHPALGLDEIAIDPERRFVTLVAYDRTLHFAGFEPSHVVDGDWLDRKAGEIRKGICEGQ